VTIDHVRQSLRLLARHKRFSALAIVSLGLAIALNTTMYSVLDALISPKSAMRDPDRLWTLVYIGDYKQVISVPELNDAYRSLSFVENATGARQSQGEHAAERNGALREVSVLMVAPNYFAVTGLRAVSGRVLGPGDQDGVNVVVGERFWKRMFSDVQRFQPQKVLIEGEPRTIVGVLSYADLPTDVTDVWRIATADEMKVLRMGLLRLKPDVTYAQAAAELEVLRIRFAERNRRFNPGDAGFRFSPAHKPPFQFGNFHLALVGSVVAVLLIACANLANLQLARGVSRARELATRAAIGASRGDIIRQLLIESGWLALGGLVLGAVLTWWSIGLVDANVPPLIADYVVRPQVTWRVVAFAIAAMLVCLVLVGLAPAVQLSRVDISELMKSGAGTGKSRGARRRYGTLVVAEVALALAVLSSASILVFAAISVEMRRLDVDDRGLVESFVGVVQRDSADRRSRTDWMQEAIQRAQSAPGVEYAATRGGRSPVHHTIAVEDGGGAPVQRAAPLWWYTTVTADYLRMMRIPIARGRDFAPGEFAEPVVIVDQRSASYLFDKLDPIGRLIKFDSANGKSPWLKVVGITATRSIDRLLPWMDPDTRDILPGMGAVYVLQTAEKGPMRVNQNLSRFGGFFQLIVRGNRDPKKIAVDLYRTLGNLGDRRNMVTYPATWEQQARLDRLRARHTFVGTLFLIFGVLALALASLGIYAIVSHAVSQRTREFGLRMAIGAGTADIRRLVLQEANVLVLLGIAIGLLLTIATSGLVAAFQLRGFDDFNVVFFALMCVVLFTATWIASYIPARRAMRIDPVEALRND
jgi:putative ABC transport system permease protein